MNALIGPVCGLLLMISALWGQSSKHPFSADDWASLRSAAPVAVAPDGATILCRISFGGEKGEDQHQWHLMRPDGSNSRTLELPELFTPFGFMPDGGALYGSYEVNKVKQLAVFGLATLKKNSEPSRLIPLPAGIQAASLSPDGTRFAILANPNPPDDLAGVHTVVEPGLTSLYVVKTDGTAGKWWCPDVKNIANTESPFSGAASMAWSPDGTTLAVLSSTPKLGFHTIHSFLDLCTSSGAHRLAEIPNVASGIAWADSGRQLLFLSTTNSVLTPDHVWSVAVSGGTAADRTPKLDGSAVLLAGDARGKVWVVVDRGVQNEIDAFNQGVLTQAYRWPTGYVAGPPVSSELASAPAQLAIAVGDPEHTENIAVPAGAALRKITTEGDEQIAKIDLGKTRVVQWTSKEGIHLEGITTFPSGFTEGRKYKFLVLPHGGPEANDLLSLDAFSRIIAGLGYVVLQPQYRGSTGYGSEFLEAIFQHFGDRAYRDVDSATDFAIAQGWADPEKLAILGWSAGGFMTSWTVTQTHRYKAAIEGAGITDWAPFLWTSDIQQFDYDSRLPEKNPEAFSQFSAVAHASAVTTPTLILHGAADLRVPTFQGREFFEVLLADGKTTRMVTYPGSPHFPKLWEQRRDVFREVASWLEKYNK
jgi:dipeptidyl aminopeptidase/acylaminoacyl peptidase